MKQIRKFPICGNPVLPAIYGETLSYAEEMGRVKQGFNDMVDNIDELDKRVEGAEQTVEGFDGRMSTAESDIDNLEQRADGVDSQIGGIQEQIDNNTLGTSVPKYNADFQDHEYELSGSLASLEDGQVGLVQKACPVPNDNDPSETDQAIIYRAKVNGWDTVKGDITGLQEKIGNNTVKTSVPRYNVQFTDHEYEIVDEHDDIYEGLEDGQVALLQKECATPNDSDPTEKFPELVTTTKVKGWEKVVTDERVWGLTEVEGNPITLEVVQENEAKGAIVKFEPKQNLNGYEYPWAGGANVNKAGFHTGGYVDATGAKVQNSQYGMTDVLAVGTSVIVDRGTAEHFGYAIFSDAECTTMIARSESDNTHDSIMYPVPSGTQYALCWWDLGSGVVASQSAMDTAHCMCVVDDVASEWSPYANVCPIEGWTELNIEGCGKNVVDYADKNNITSQSYWDYRTLPAGNYILSAQIKDTNQVGVNLRLTSEGAYIAVTDFVYTTDFSLITKAFTLTKETTFRLSLAGSATGYNGSAKNVQIEVGSTATPYEAYREGVDITVGLGQTVYGGELDVTKGQIKKTWNTANMGSLWWAVSSVEAHIFAARVTNILPPTTNNERKDGLMCEIYGTSQTITLDTHMDDHSMLKSGEFLYIRDTRFRYINEFKEYLAGIYLIYKAQTPTIITDLTPAQISLLEGVNTLWTDGKSLDVLYVSDIATIKQLNDKLADTIGDIAGTEYATATSNHAVNDFLIYDGGFYKVISAITAGDTLVVGTNIRKTTVGAELTAILNGNSNRKVSADTVAKEVAKDEAEASTREE